MRILDITNRRRQVFLWLRMAAFVSVMALFASGYGSGRLSLDIVWFSFVNAMWFGLSLCVQHFGRKAERHAAGQCILYAMIDTYVIVSSIALALQSSSVCVSVYGAYCLVLAAVCGPLVGAIAAATGAAASLGACGNTVGLTARLLVVGATGVICGAAWYVGVPFLWTALRQAQATRVSHGDGQEESEAGVADKLAEMSRRLAEISRERDEGQERICELEALVNGSQAADAEADAAAGDAGQPSERVAELEALLEQAQAEVKALTFEKNNMASEIETMSKELEAAYGGGEAEAEADSGEEDEVAAAFAAIAAAKEAATGS